MIFHEGKAYLDHGLICHRGIGNLPLAQIVSMKVEDGYTYICSGYNKPPARRVHGDRFCHCVKSLDGCDIHHDMDRRDMIDFISVMAQAGSADEILRVEPDTPLTEAQMNDTDWIEELTDGEGRND